MDTTPLTLAELDATTITTIIGLMITLFTTIFAGLLKVLSWSKPYIDTVIPPILGAIHDHRTLVQTLEKNESSQGATLQQIAETQLNHSGKLHEIHTAVTKTRE